MCAFVLRSWTASSEPSGESSVHVAIHGRGAGAGSWLLRLVGIDPSASVEITGEDIKLSANRLTGDVATILPLEQLSSTRHGWHRPWASALALAAASAWLGSLFALRRFGLLGTGLTAAGWVAAAWYFLQSRILVLAWIGHGGEHLEFHFHPGNVAGEEISQPHAAFVCELTHVLAEKRAAALAAAASQRQSAHP